MLGFGSILQAIVPIFDTVQGVIQDESYERASVTDSASLPDDQKEDCSDSEVGVPVSNDDTATWGQLTVHLLLEEFKIALISYSEAPHQFETWMNSVIDIPDEVSSRESCGGTSFAAQGGSYSQHFIGRRESFPNVIPCCVIGEFALIALEANMALNLIDIQSRDGHLQCDFSLQEAVIHDKIADSTVRANVAVTYWLTFV